MIQSRSEVTRDKIVRAATEIIQLDGIQACTHRAVAKLAGVSLGTTTYQFSTLDDLLLAVMEVAVDNFATSTREWFSVNAHDNKEDILVKFLCWTLDEMSRLNAEYELFVAAVSRPMLRSCALSWLRTHESLLAEYLALSALQARSAVTLIDAWLMRGILENNGSPVDQNHIRSLFRCILQSPDPVAPH